MWKLLLSLLFVSLHHGIVDDEGGGLPPAGDDTPPADDDTPPDDDDTPPADDDTPPADDHEPEPRESRAQRTIRETRDRAQTAERQLAEANAALDAARRGPAQPTADQQLWQEEEAALRNPEVQDWQKYAINANRAARRADTNSQNALNRAEDLADRSEFALLGSEKPKLYAAYKDKVEEKLKDIRSKGGNAPRKGLLALLVGEAMLEGKLKQSTPQTNVRRGTTPGARSDVSSSGGRLTDAEKVAKRLEGVRI